MQGTENLLPSPAKPDQRPKTPPPVRPAPPKVVVDGKTVTHKEEPTMESVQAEIKELRMALELLQTRHEWVLLISNDRYSLSQRCVQEKNESYSILKKEILFPIVHNWESIDRPSYLLLFMDTGKHRKWLIKCSKRKKFFIWNITEASWVNISHAVCRCRHTISSREVLKRWIYKGHVFKNLTTCHVRKIVMLLD